MTFAPFAQCWCGVCFDSPEAIVAHWWRLLDAGQSLTHHDRDADRRRDQFVTNSGVRAGTRRDEKARK